MDDERTRVNALDLCFRVQKPATISIGLDTYIVTDAQYSARHGEVYIKTKQGTELIVAPGTTFTLIDHLS